MRGRAEGGQCVHPAQCRRAFAVRIALSFAPRHACLRCTSSESSPTLGPRMRWREALEFVLLIALASPLNHVAMLGAGRLARVQAGLARAFAVPSHRSARASASTRTCRSVCRSRSASIGLVRKSFMPAAIASSRSETSAAAVRATMGSVWRS